MYKLPAPISQSVAWLDNRFKRGTMRQSNWELLRIVCMVLIVTHHLAVHGGYNFDQINPVNAGIIRVLMSGGKIGVNVFVLISGYFSVTSSCRPKKLLSLLGKMTLYAVVIYVSLALAGYVPWSVGGLLSSLFPVPYDLYWFMTCYVCLYMLSPLLNLVIKRITRQQHLILVLLLWLFSTTTFVFAHIPFVGTEFFASTVWFVMLYCIAAYLRLYPAQWMRAAVVVPVACGTMLMIAALAIVNIVVWNLRDPPCLVASVALFCAFGHISLSSKTVNTLSRATFGVYLLHDNRYLRPVLWQQWLQCRRFADHGAFVLYALACIVGVYGICTAIELGRTALTDLACKRWRALWCGRRKSGKQAEPGKGTDNGLG